MGVKGVLNGESSTSAIYMSNRKLSSGKRRIVFDSNYDGSWFGASLPEAFDFRKYTSSQSVTISPGGQKWLTTLDTGFRLIHSYLAGSGTASIVITNLGGNQIWAFNAHPDTTVTFDWTLIAANFSGLA